jgi:general secretion pathway protein A
MYETFYGFREKPFHVTADPSFLYPSHQHQEALAHLKYGIWQRLGFILLTGEIGTGKTTVAKRLIQELEPPTRTALILNPMLNATQLLRAILRDLQISSDFKNPTVTSGLSLQKGELLIAIEELLLKEARDGGNVVILIDEAQDLSAPVLEQLRLLSNIETTKSKLLQIILVGQPELTQRLNTEPQLSALRQRIAVRYEILPLDGAGIAAYIHHRLERACAGVPPHFTPEAIEQITLLSGGNPRQINLLCDQALLAGFVKDSHIINAAMILDAAMIVRGMPHELNR